MKRIIVLLTVAALMMAMLAMSVVPALAQEGPPSMRQDLPRQQQPGCDEAQEGSPVISYDPQRLNTACELNPAAAPTP
jgi:hypothetical protein